MKHLLILCAFLALLSTGCRRDYPPPIEPICTMDGFGGGDCVHTDGKREYLAPSQMKNYWATSQESQAAFSAWCYGVKVKTAYKAMAQIKRRIFHGPNLNPNRGFDLLTELDLSEELEEMDALDQYLDRRLFPRAKPLEARAEDEEVPGV